MARASGKTLRIWSNAVPFLPNTLELVRSGVASAGLTANQSAVAPQVSWADGVPEPARLAMVDPQTSGGLLVALPASRVKAYLTLLSRRRIRGVVVGEVVRQARRLLEVAV
jgi:selenide,water dikinase